MINRRPLPPSPYELSSDEPADLGPDEEPADLGPDDEAVVAARDAAMLELATRGLSVWRLLALWLAAGVAVLGWAALGLASDSFEQGGLGALSGLVGLVLGALFLLPASIGIAVWVSTGREIRDRLDDWADVGAELVTDERLRAERRCAGWLLSSAALCGYGVWTLLNAGGAAESVTVGQMLYAYGLAATVLLAGVLGFVRAAGHLRWSGRLLRPVSGRGRGGAHR
ncbi:hypothetical protein HY68_06715 [Streptomyces sp. AcH 505]|uniref:hypothetical protein n=1 Tax=unclassified Streptomyces TaxID=2593676 RepID=UPI000591C8F9|nr:hypothetical protein [Streptomyces sp. NBC_00370]KIF68388.1 hypothetical protein HY68_06715 [Streptomyces sp. AcH 505]